MPQKKKKRAAARKPIVPETLTEFRLPARPRISPDGKRIVYIEKTVSKPGKYETRLWMLDTSGGEPRAFTHGPKDSSPCWSPEGDRVAFIRTPEGEASQIYVIDAAGGEARKLTSFPRGSIGEFRFSPAGGKLAVAFRETAEERTEEARKKREEEGRSTPPWVIDDPWFRLDGDGYFGAARYKLYLVDLETGEHSLLYDRDKLGGF